MVNQQRLPLMFGFATLVLGMFLAPATLNAEVGYAWADKPNSSSYTPSKKYSYNGAGGGIVVRHTATGHYRVLFVRLGRKGPGGGFAEASAYGNAAAFCRVVRWNYTANHGRDFDVEVACASAHGPVNTLFTVLAGWPNSGSGKVGGIHKIPPKHLPWNGGGDERADMGTSISTLQRAINVLNDQVNAIRIELNKLAQ